MNEKVHPYNGTSCVHHGGHHRYIMGGIIGTSILIPTILLLMPRILERISRTYMKKFFMPIYKNILIKRQKTNGRVAATPSPNLDPLGSTAQRV